MLHFTKSSNVFQIYSFFVIDKMSLAESNMALWAGFTHKLYFGDPCSLTLTSEEGHLQKLHVGKMWSLLSFDS